MSYNIQSPSSSDPHTVEFAAAGAPPWASAVVGAGRHCHKICRCKIRLGATPRVTAATYAERRRPRASSAAGGRATSAVDSDTGRHVNELWVRETREMEGDARGETRAERLRSSNSEGRSEPAPHPMSPTVAGLLHPIPPPPLSLYIPPPLSLLHGGRIP
jgi:hypothetical protein